MGKTVRKVYNSRSESYKSDHSRNNKPKDRACHHSIRNQNRSDIAHDKIEFR